MSSILCRAALLLFSYALAYGTALAVTPEEFAAMEPEKALQMPAEQAIGVFGWRRQDYLFVLENALIDLRYLYRRPSGKPSAQLTAAVKAFQREYGMKPTGRLTVGEFMDLARRGNEFWQAPIYAGALTMEHTEDRLTAQGSWRAEDGKESDPVQGSSLRCYRHAGLCSVVTAKLLMADESGGWFHSSSIDLDLRARDYAISEWSNARIVAQDSTLCVVYTLTIEAEKQIAVIDTHGVAGEKCGGAPAPARRYVLAGGYEVTAPYWEARQARLLRLRSRAFQDLLAKLRGSGG